MKKAPIWTMLSGIGVLWAISLAPVIAETFNLFEPVDGILVGDDETYVTTAADSSDIISLWTGTCDASSFLRADGACISPAGAGTVTSVGLSMPGGFTVTNSPITGSGNLTVTTALSGLLAGDGTDFLEATATNVTAEFSGTCNSTTYLRGDGSCDTPPGTAVGANPTGTIGLTAVNGSAGTFLRSDGAPALSQAIAPTWSSQHIFNAINNDGAISLQSNLPVLGFVENDAVANNRRWRFDVNGETFTGRIGDDAWGVSTPWIQVDRTGTTVDTVNFANGTLQSGGNFVPNVTSSPTWTGAHTFTVVGAATTSAVRSSSTVPIVELNETDAAANNRRWRLIANGESFDADAVTDDGLTATTWLRVQRTASAVDSITFAANAIISTGATVNASVAFTPNSGSSTTSVVGAAGAAGGIITGSAAGDLALRTNSRDIRFSVDNGSTSALLLNSSGTLTMPGIFSASALRTNSTGQEKGRFVNDSAYVSFYNSADSVRSGYLQMTSAGAALLQNEISGGTVNIATTGGGAVNINGIAAGYMQTTSNTVAATGFSSTVNVSANCTRIIGSGTTSGTVSCRFNAPNGPSNTSGFSVTALIPSGYRPAADSGCSLMGTNNGVQEMVQMVVLSSGTVEYRRISGSWTNIGTKGIFWGYSCSWPLD